MGLVAHSLHAMPSMSFAFPMLSMWAVTPILLLCMIDNGSPFEPISQPVYKSMSSRMEAWGAMYMQTAIAMTLLFLFVALYTLPDPMGDIVLGLVFPFIAFFIFNQYGILAGRISGVTELGFHGDFSDD